MSWQNAIQLHHTHSNSQFRDRLGDLFALRQLLAKCLVDDGYSPPSGIERMIVLTPTGIEWKTKLAGAMANLTQQELHLALFLHFYHQDLLLEVQNCDLEGLFDCLNTEILGGRVQFPWIFGRVLYDRFFELFPNQTDSLSHTETVKLLEGTPSGVFQVRGILVGPFGVLHSTCQRSLLPTRSLPLWHCSDPSCDAFHTVTLTTGKSRVAEAGRKLQEFQNSQGPPSEWGKFFSVQLNGASDWYDDMSLDELPLLLGTCFSEKELPHILTALLEQHSKEMRELFPTTRRFKSLLSGSATQIASKLSADQRFQIMLLTLYWFSENWKFASEALGRLLGPVGSSITL